MHWGTGAVSGALRGVWAVTGNRGAHTNAWPTVARLVFVPVGKAAGVGAPPTTQPVRMINVDVPW